MNNTLNVTTKFIYSKYIPAPKESSYYFQVHIDYVINCVTGRTKQIFMNFKEYNVLNMFSMNLEKNNRIAKKMIYIYKFRKKQITFCWDPLLLTPKDNKLLGTTAICSLLFVSGLWVLVEYAFHPSFLSPLWVILPWLTPCRTGQDFLRPARQAEGKTSAGFRLPPPQLQALTAGLALPSTGPQTPWHSSLPTLRSALKIYIYFTSETVNHFHVCWWFIFCILLWGTFIALIFITNAILVIPLLVVKYFYIWILCLKKMYIQVSFSFIFIFGF